MRSNDGAFSNDAWEIVTGCTKISTGCKHCYVERALGDDFNRIVTHPERLAEPSTWPKPRLVQVCDHGDLLHAGVPSTFVQRAIDVMIANPQHDFLLLTKRSARLYLEMLDRSIPNILVGVSAENQATLDDRVPGLFATKMPRRFLSFQPLIAPIVLPDPCPVDWVCVGEEFGPKRRPMSERWVRDLRDQCAAQGITFRYQQRMRGDQREVFPPLDGRRHHDQPPRMTAGGSPAWA